MAQQSDGKLVIAGGAEFINGFFPTLVRYFPDGSLDTSFGTNGIVWKDYGTGNNADYNRIYFQPPDKIIAGTKYGQGFGFRLTRFFENGTVDSSFGINGDLLISLPDIQIIDLKFLNDGKFMASGYNNNTPSEIIVIRYLENGELDTSFGVNGVITILIGNQNNYSGKLEITEDNNFFVLGYTMNFGESEYFLLKFLSNGDLNPSFGVNGVADIPGDEVSCNFQLSPGSKIVLSCFDSNSHYFTRLLADGSLDISFGNGGSFIYPYFFPRAFLVQQNNRILLSGNPQDPLEGGGYLYMDRYHQGGSTDSSFDYNVIYPELDSTRTILQEDGKIVVAGTSMWYNGPVDFVLQRFNNNPLAVPEYNLNNLKVYPNPSLGNFTIEHDFIIGADIPYYITDVSGKVLQKGVLSGEQTTIDLSPAESGMYLLSTSTQTVRLIKE